MFEFPNKQTIFVFFMENRRFLQVSSCRAGIAATLCQELKTCPALYFGVGFSQ
jgi:hypothetical protein